MSLGWHELKKRLDLCCAPLAKVLFDGHLVWEGKPGHTEFLMYGKPAPVDGGAPQLVIKACPFCGAAL